MQLSRSISWTDRFALVGQPLEALANAALRDYVRYENQVGASIERGMADVEVGRVRSTEEVLSYLQEQRCLRSRE